MTDPDLYQADHVEIQIAQGPDGFRLWVNVEGRNRLRIYRIKNIRYDFDEILRTESA